MAIEYDLQLWTRRPNQVLVYSIPNADLHSFTVSTFLRTGGSVEVRLHNIENYIEKLSLPQALDYEWRIYRRNTVFQKDKELLARGMHRGSQFLQLKAGNWLCFSYAVTPSVALTAEATTIENGSKEGFISDVALEYATELLAPFPTITINTNIPTSSKTWAGERPYKKLPFLLDELANLDDAEYIIDENYVFQWIYPKTYSDVIDTASRFITDLRVVENYIGIATHATVLGSGSDEERLTVTEYDDEFYGQYGEFYYNHIVRTTSGKTEDVLSDKALGLMAERKNEVLDVSFQLTNHESFLFIKDVNVGDIVPIDFFGRILNVLLHSVYVTLNKEGVESILFGGKFINEG